MSVFRKIISEHLREGEMRAGEEIGISIDQVLIQDITGTVVMLNFEAMGLPRVRCEVAAAYGDHNVLQVDSRNTEDHHYLASASKKYGVWWGKPSSGIGHQLHQEHFARPGVTALGADSHTPHCGGMGMVAIGAGGLDVAVALAGGLYFLKMPQVVNVHLSGELQAWCTAKDVILEMLRRLTVRGGVGKVLEYTGPGIRTLNAQQRCTITNMGAELGASTSVFPSDDVTRDFLRRMGREDVWKEVLPDEGFDYEERVDVNLSKIEPLVALPSLPDKVVGVSEARGTPVHQVFVGSCTNGSYMDLKAVAKIMKGKKVHHQVDFLIHASSKKDLELIAREGHLTDLLEAGVNVAEPTCGACIGSGHVPASGTNSLRVANRNFQGRSGLKEDQVYLSSAEVGAASAIAGAIADPRELDMDAPGQDLPELLTQENPNLIPPALKEGAERLQVQRGPNIQPVPAKEPLEDQITAEVLLKVGDDITTDHIMPAASNILIFRSNIPKLAEYVYHRVDSTFAERAKARGTGLIVGGLNYGQGSSREHAALAPMFLGIRGVIAKSFARIHMANLINWGLIPLQFVEAGDFDDIEQGDDLELSGVIDFVRKRDTIELVNKTRNTQYQVRLVATPRERRVLIAGGRLSEAKAMGS